MSRLGWPASARPSQPPSSLSSNSERMSKEEESEEGGSEESEEASRRDGEDVEGLGLGNTRRQSQFPADTQWMTQQNQT